MTFLNKKEILELLPHREPMLLIDELKDIVTLDSATAIMHVKKNAFYVDGHFPNNPVMPGVLIVEAFGQAAAALTAFGIDKKDINQELVQTAAKIANIDDFVTKLPEQYQTTVGERGVRLSGGERQRIGIARALYRNPQVLMLDEATSALDNLTEQLVMKEIQKIGNKKTIIMIAHRLSTVKNCNIIFYLEKGELKAQGTYEELIKSSEGFKKIENK